MFMNTRERTMQQDSATLLYMTQLMDKIYGVTSVPFIHQAGEQSPDAEQLFLLKLAIFHKRFVADIRLPGSV